MRKKLPVGMDIFEKVRKNDFYYADKTMLIAELLQNWGEVNLFTRPRRFGKSLNMSMLKAFFEIGTDKSLFKGLKISEEEELCENYMGKFPVVSITLKGVDGLNYQEACGALRGIIGKEALRFRFLADSGKLSPEERAMYRQLIEVGNAQDAIFTMTDAALIESLHTLSQLLAKHYGCRTILLIDEYDVPLDKAFQAGYYEEMVSLMRKLLGNALKSNDELYFAVLTGCLRISKESIFTGLNNLKTYTITDARYDEYFGFTDTDVNEMLEFYGLNGYKEIFQEWYDGYQFGNVSVYCPWDVLNYCDALLCGQEVQPENYWVNTSGNAMVRRFIGKADRQTRSEMERLIAGESVVKELDQELTYNELDNSIDNLWSVLFSTGYLTQRGQVSRKQYKLMIPNREIRELFTTQIWQWFKENARADEGKLERFCTAFPGGDAAAIEQQLKEYLWNSISIRDTAVRTERKENFYHGMLLGLLQYETSWAVKSNIESGDGYSDILIETPDRIGVVIEVKYAPDNSLDKWCSKALSQIEQKKYDTVLFEDGMETVIQYGIAFFKKNCRVLMK